MKFYTEQHTQWRGWNNHATMTSLNPPPLPNPNKQKSTTYMVQHQIGRKQKKHLFFSLHSPFSISWKPRRKKKMGKKHIIEMRKSLIDALLTVKICPGFNHWCLTAYSAQRNKAGIKAMICIRTDYPSFMDTVALQGHGGNGISDLATNGFNLQFIRQDYPIS